MKRFLDHMYAKVIFAVIALVSLGLAWALALRAIDTGNLLEYVGTFVLAIICIQAVVYLIAALRR